MTLAGEGRTKSDGRSWTFWVAVLVLIAAARIFLTTTDSPQTIDEGAHILCGLEWIDRGTYRIEEQHPPLARIAVAIGPYLAGLRLPAGTERRDMWEAGNALLKSGSDYRSTLRLARLGTLPFFLAAVFVLACWAKRWFGFAGGIIAVVLLSTAPPILANAGLATTDMAAAATVFLAIGSFFALISQPALKTALFAGCSVGLAVLAKFSSIPFLGLALAGLLFFRWLLGPPIAYLDRAFWRRSAMQLVIALLACALVVWAGFRFSVGPLLPRSDRPHAPLIALAEGLSLAPNYFDEIVEAPVYPAAEVLRGILEVRHHNLRGHLAFFLGEVRTQGWWYFFPVVFAVKTPIPFLLLGFSGFALLLVQGFRRRDWRLPALAVCFVAIMCFVMTVHINLGLRHILILYPLLALAAASLGPLVGRSRLALAVVTLLVCWQGVESLAAHPNYLAHFNQFAGAHPENIRVSADLDWGQDLYRLADAVEERHIDKLSFAYFGSVDPREHLPIEVELLDDGRHATGWVAISVSRLKMAPEKYSWLENYDEYALIGKTIRLYNIPEGAP